MKEGWIDDNDYLIIFDDNKLKELNINYNVKKYLPHLKIIGIINWDDFILKNDKGKYFRCPTIPINEKYIEIISSDFLSFNLQKDTRLVGKIKWYQQPIIFGGSPTDPKNITWITVDEHIKLVKWWNDKYIEVSNSQ